MKKIAIVSIVAPIFLMSCAPMNNQQTGALTGGVIGGLVGSQFGGGAGKVAAAAGGALLGTFIGSRIGQTMDSVDQMKMQRAFDTAPTGQEVGWKNPDSGNQYTVRPTRTYYTGNQPCREYTTHANIGGKLEQIHGTACRQADGAWKIRN